MMEQKSALCFDIGKQRLFQMLDSFEQRAFILCAVLDSTQTVLSKIPVYSVENIVGTQEPDYQ